MKKLQLLIALFVIVGTVNLSAYGKTYKNSSEDPNFKKHALKEARDKRDRDTGTQSKLATKSKAKKTSFAKSATEKSAK
ncbi:MAG: hypothetical protein JO129_04480 [Candidatus Dependentiae bacterium]|nr:hypothetical protein [Candidatus Dependentiae bacterium]